MLGGARGGSRINARVLARGLLYVLSVGLALHLVLPQIPGLERSAELVVGAAPLLVVAALVAEAASEACYAELLGRTAGAAAGKGTSPASRRRAGIGRWFTLRLTVAGYAAAHVLPGGGATAAAVTFGALRSRGLDAKAIALAVATVSVLVYGSLGLFLAVALVLVLAQGDLGAMDLAGALAGYAILALLAAGCYAAYRNPRPAARVLGRLSFPVARMFRRGLTRPEADAAADGLVRGARERVRSARRELVLRPQEALRWCALAFCYWAFDALCLVIVFRALGVPVGVEDLLIAYVLATVAGTLPLTPGGIGVFEATMLAALALLGTDADAVLAILGYRLFNFWLPIPLGAVAYPSLRRAGAASEQFD